MMLCFLFFFKQKTAYEMRISDWSSDVCSSDLEGEAILFDVAARSFLHHQVRSMVGCLELVGCGKWSAADLKAALEARDRHALGFNAPPDGLYFAAAIYPADVPSPNNR